MKESTREQLNDFADNPLHELQCGVVSDTVDIVENPPIVLNFERPARTRQLRISGKRSHSVTRHLNLWHYGDVSLRRIGDYLANLVFRVETAVHLPSALSIGRNFSETGKSINLYAPALIFR